MKAFTLFAAVSGLASVSLLGAGDQTGPTDQPQVILRDAERVQMRGGGSAAPDKTGETDCNSPAHWDGDTLYLFNSAGIRGAAPAPTSSNSPTTTSRALLPSPVGCDHGGPDRSQ